MRATATITAWNLASRVTGLVRVLAVAGALGTTFLGNTYQSANLVSNVLFELLAAGLLSAPLVPVLVGLLAEDRRGDANRLLGSLTMLCLVVLGTVAVLGAVAGRAVMGLLSSGAPAGVRAAEVALGAFFLWVFLPQLVLYGIGAVSTAALHADRRFAAASAAPVANNVLVILTMVAFAATTTGRLGLELDTPTKILLAGGTTAGVLAMSAVPLLSARRAGFRLRPRWDRHAPGLSDLARQGGWAAALLASNQLMVVATLVLANRVEGGVVAYQAALAFFLLPFALLAHPVITALFPTLARRAHDGDLDGFAIEGGDGVRVLLFLLLPATALLVALASPALALVRVGALGSGDAAFVGRVLAAYAVGLLGFAGLNFGARAFAALGDLRTPALVGGLSAAAGVGLMILGAVAVTGRDEVVALGAATSAANLTGAVLLFVLLRRRVGRPIRVGPTFLRSLVGSCALGGAAWTAARAAGGPGRGGAAVALLAGGLAALLVGVAAQWLLRSPELAWALRAFRARAA